MEEKKFVKKGLQNALKDRYYVRDADLQLDGPFKGAQFSKDTRFSQDLATLKRLYGKAKSNKKSN